MALVCSHSQMERHMKGSTVMTRSMVTESLHGSIHQLKDAMRVGGPRANKMDLGS